MLAVLKAWIERRRRSHHRCQEDACRLVQQDEAAAYYEAQRLTVRARPPGILLPSFIGPEWRPKWRGSRRGRKWTPPC